MVSDQRAPLRAHARRVSAWAWSKVAIPKIFTLTMVFTYLFLLPGWIWGLINPPNSLEGVVGLVSMYFISVLIVVGAAVGIPAAIAGQNRVERWSTLAVLVGIGMYVVIIHILHWGSEGNRLPQASTIQALAPLLSARLFWVWRRPVAAAEEVLIPGRGDTDLDD